MLLDAWAYIVKKEIAKMKTESEAE